MFRRKAKNDADWRAANALPESPVAPPGPPHAVPKRSRRRKITLWVVAIVVVWIGVAAVIGAIVGPQKKAPAVHSTASPAVKSAALTASWTKVAFWNGAASPLTDFESHLFTARKSADRLGWNVTPGTGQYVWTIAFLKKGQSPNSSAPPVVMVTGQLGGGSLSSANSGACGLRLKPGVQYYIWAELHNCSAAVAVSQQGSAGSTAWNGVPTTPRPTAAVSSTPSATMPQQERDARHFISSPYGREARQVQVRVEFVWVALGLAKQKPTQANVDELAQVAQESHDEIAGVRDDFAMCTTSHSGTLQDVEGLLYSDAGEVKNAMGAMVAYCGAPNAATLARFTTQYDQARTDWDRDVRAIWAIAREKKPPTF